LSFDVPVGLGGLSPEHWAGAARTEQWPAGLGAHATDSPAVVKKTQPAALGPNEWHVASLGKAAGDKICPLKVFLFIKTQGGGCLCNMPGNGTGTFEAA